LHVADVVVTVHCVCCVCTHCRRQTAEEREAERQAASRFMLSLQSGGASAGGDAGDADKTSALHAAAPDPLCINNASLHALQNLRPWADDSAAAAVERSQRDNNDSNDTDADDDDDDVSDDASDEHDDLSAAVDTATAVVHLHQQQQHSASRRVHQLRPLNLTAA